MIVRTYEINVFKYIYEYKIIYIYDIEYVRIFKKIIFYIFSTHTNIFIGSERERYLTNSKRPVKDLYAYKNTCLI